MIYKFTGQVSALVTCHVFNDVFIKNKSIPPTIFNPLTLPKDRRPKGQNIS